MPIIIEVCRNDNIIDHTIIIKELDTPIEEYVHSGQILRVREMTTEEVHNMGLKV